MHIAEHLHCNSVMIYLHCLICKNDVINEVQARFLIVSLKVPQWFLTCHRGLLFIEDWLRPSTRITDVHILYIHYKFVLVLGTVSSQFMLVNCAQ